MATLFNEPLVAIDQADRRAALLRLRQNGLVPVTRGRGLCTIYVNDAFTACVVARRRVTGKGIRWSFERHGKLSRAAVRFLHEQLRTA